MFAFVFVVATLLLVLAHAVRPKAATMTAVATPNNLLFISHPPSKKTKIASLKSWRSCRRGLRRLRRKSVWPCSFVPLFCLRLFRAYLHRAFRDHRATYQVFL